jgi:hypothetical protein
MVQPRLHRVVFGLVRSIVVPTGESPGLTSASFTAVAPNCDDVRCPHETVEVTRGVAGICPCNDDISVPILVF